MLMRPAGSALHMQIMQRLCMPCSGRAGVDAGPGAAASPPALGCDTGSSHSVLRVRAGTDPALLHSSTEWKN